MARRRFNWKFFGYVAGGVAAVPAIAFVGFKLRPKDPNKFISAGDQYQRKGDLPDALSAYSFAVGLRPADPQLHLKLGHVHDLMRDQDFWGNINAAVDEYTKAEELQPDLKEAWRGLLDANMAAALAIAGQASKIGQEQMFRLPERFAVARDAAQHLLKLDPADAKARTAIPILTINLWLANLPVPLTAEERALPLDRQPTDVQRIDRATADLTAAMRDHPEDADLPYWVGLAKIEEGVRLSRQANLDPGAGGDPNAVAVTGGGDLGTDRSARVRTLFGEAAVVFDDPIARRPTDAQLYYKKFEVLTRLMRADHDPEAIVQYQHLQRAALDMAQSLVTPTDGLPYAGYKSQWADYLAVNDPAAAEVAYKGLLARPTTAPAAGRGPDTQRLIEDTQVRLQYAKMLARDPTRRDDALAVLAPVPAATPAGMLPGLQEPVSRLLAAARLLRSQVLTDQYESLANPTTRAAKAKAAQAEIDAVRANPRFAGEYEVLKAQGRLYLVSGVYREAIQTLAAAADRLAGNGGGTDYELLDWQAQADANGGQPDRAVKLLEQAVQNPPGANLLQPHLMLAQLYLQQQDYEHGRQQVGWLSERYPDDVRTIHVQIEALGRDPDPKAVADLYNRLPERTPAEQVDKANWAVRTNNAPDAERLLERVYAARPGNPATAIQLSQLYASDHKLGRANEVLQQAMDLHPENRGSFQIIKDGINGASEAAIQKEVEDRINQFKDPVMQATVRAKLAAARGQLPEQIVQLQKVRALQPDNARNLNDLFLCYLAAKDYDKAQDMLPRLAALDVDNARGLLFRFRLAMARRDTAAAVAVGQQLTHDYANFASSWSSLGEAMQASGQWEAAVQQYTASLAHQGNNPEVIRRLVDCLIRLGRLDDARRALNDARQKYPDAPVYRQQLVQVEVAYGDPEAVLPVVDQGVANHPDAPDSYQTAVQAYAAAAQRRSAKADVDAANGFTDKAEHLLSDALKRWPDNAAFAAELGDLQAHDGTEAGIAAAAATFKALGETPRWKGQALPDVLLGRMYLQAKRPDAAEPPLRHAVELNPRATDARLALADALTDRHHPDAALDVLSPAKDQPAARAKYVDLLLALNRGPEAEAELLADLKAHPEDPAPANLLAHVYAAQGKFDAAQDVATKTLEADPKDVGAYFVRGATEAGRTPPDLEAAARDLSVFRTAYPDNVQGRIALARVLLARHDVEQATVELEAAVDLAPDGKEGRLLLAQAYLAARPPRALDAERVVSQALASPPLAHDPDVQRVAAAVYLRAGDGDRAVTSIRDAMAHATDQRAMLDEYLDVLLATKHYDTLLAESAKFADDPKAAWTLFDVRGRARAASGDVPGAVAEFTTALDRAGTAADLGPSLAVAAHLTAGLGIDRAVELIGLRSQNSTAWKVVLANCYSQAGDRDKALATIEGVMPSLATLAPADRLSVTRLAAVLYMTANPPQPDRAVALFQDVLKQSPDDVDALNNLACLLAEQVHPPRPQEALAYSTRAVQRLRALGQTSPFVADTQGWVLILNGRLDEGIDVLHQIVDGADFPDAHYHLAEGYLRKGAADDARRELTAAMQVYRAADAAHRTVDRSLPDKIAAAQRQANQMGPDKP